MLAIKILLVLILILLILLIGGIFSLSRKLSTMICDNNKDFNNLNSKINAFKENNAYRFSNIIDRISDIYAYMQENHDIIKGEFKETRESHNNINGRVIHEAIEAAIANIKDEPKVGSMPKAKCGYIENRTDDLPSSDSYLSEQPKTAKDGYPKKKRRKPYTKGDL